MFAIWSPGVDLDITIDQIRGGNVSLNDFCPNLNELFDELCSIRYCDVNTLMCDNTIYNYIPFIRGIQMQLSANSSKSPLRFWLEALPIPGGDQNWFLLRVEVSF